MFFATRTALAILTRSCGPTRTRIGGDGIPQ
jgi:hypothetical protein